MLRLADISVDGEIDLANLRRIGLSSEEIEKYRLLTGDLLAFRVNGSRHIAGRVACYRGPAGLAFCDHFIRFRLFQPIEPRFLAWAFNARDVRAAVERKIVSTAGQNTVSQASLAEVQVPVAPALEQRRIVAALDSYLTRLAAAESALQRVQVNLKRYRASVLKAAVEGRLVTTEAELARREGRDYEPASELLKRILAERRRRWEEAELAKMKANGKAPKDDGWKAKYLEPVEPDVTQLPELPEGWCWASLDHILLGVQAGKSFRCLERPPGPHEVGVVKVSAVSWGFYDEDETKTCTRKEFVDSDLFVNPGDFLISRANTIELVGACVIAPTALSRKAMLSDKVLRLNLLDGFSHWLLWWLRSHLGRRAIESLATGNQESMRNISQASLRRIPFALPPVSEASRILGAIAHHLSIESHSEETLQLNGEKLTRLRQAILRWAFEGKLVDQDPSDEPAAELLARVRAAREAAALERRSDSSRSMRKTRRKASRMCP